MTKTKRQPRHLGESPWQSAARHRRRRYPHLPGAIGSTGQPRIHPSPLSPASNRLRQTSASASPTAGHRRTGEDRVRGSLRALEPTFIDGMDTLIPNLTDGNANLPHGSATASAPQLRRHHQGGLALKLQTPTVVSKLTFSRTPAPAAPSVYTNSSASLDGAVEGRQGHLRRQRMQSSPDASSRARRKGRLRDHRGQQALPAGGAWVTVCASTKSRWSNQPIT